MKTSPLQNGLLLVTLLSNTSFKEKSVVKSWQNVTISDTVLRTTRKGTLINYY